MSLSLLLSSFVYNYCFNLLTCHFSQTFNCATGSTARDSDLDDFFLLKMVRIVNGCVVDDDDPRARRGQDRQPRQGGYGRIHQQQQQDEQVRGQVPHGHGAPGVHQVSPLATANEKLKSLGIPTLQVAGYQLEPLVMVGFVLAFCLMGLPGLLLGCVLFYLHQTQGNNAFQVPTRGLRQHR